jgi:zinc transport system substrate-binding protein
LIARRIKLIAAVVTLVLGIVFTGCGKSPLREQHQGRKSIVASDTILSGMCEALLPPDFFAISAILPPGQCPGHYDVKFTDIAKVKQADLVISFCGMPFMNQTEIAADKHLIIDTNGSNWMAPPSYVAGLGILTDRLLERFPEQRQQILRRKERAIREVEEMVKNLDSRLRQASVSQKPVIASSMLKEPLEWMGFRVAGEYGRPESLSAKEIVELTRIGQDQKAVIIVDNLQSGPEAGKGIAEALKIPHVTFSNFPSEKGYAATLSENVNSALAASGTN